MGGGGNSISTIPTTPAGRAILYNPIFEYDLLHPILVMCTHGLSCSPAIVEEDALVEFLC